MAATARSYADTVAERAAALGVPPGGRPETVASALGPPSVKDGRPRDTDVVRLTAESPETATGRPRGRIDATE